MENKSDKIYIQNLSMFTTEKCNLQCAHCMRGDCTNKKISDQVIEKTLDQIIAIGTLSICGGEPTLALDKLEKIITYIIEHKILLSQFAVTINGTIYSDELVRLCHELFSYISSFDKKDRRMIDISYDVFHKSEWLRLGLLESVIENIRKYQESPYFGYFRTLDPNLKLFRCGRAVHLDKKLTVPLRSMNYYICYAGKKNKLTNIGPLVSVNVDGIVTECNASFEEQRTIYNYSNVLDNTIENICIKNKAKVLSPRKWNKEIERYLTY